MNDTVAASIAVQLAELGRLVPTPSGDLGYGSDLSCVADLTEDLAELDPFSVRGIGEAAIRRLTTPRGSLPDEPDYGLDVRMYLNRGTTFDELRELAGRCSLELAKDDRIDTARVDVSKYALGSELAISVRITPASPTLAPFALTFLVTSGSVAMEEIG